MSTQSQKIDLKEDQVIELDKIDAKKVLGTERFKKLLKEGEEKGFDTKDVEAFYTIGLQKMFDNQNKTVSQFIQIMESVIDIEQCKLDAKEVIETYEKISKDPVVKDALRKLDNEMNEITPIVRKMQNALEESSGFFGKAWSNLKNLFSKGDGTILSNALEGLKGRVDSIGNAFKEYEYKLKVNQEISGKRIPELSKRIFQVNGMIEVLEIVRDEVSNAGTKDFLSNVINQLAVINGIQYESLQRLIVAARMNGNTHLLLKATEFKVFGSMPSLVALSYILNVQSEVNAISGKADDFINVLQESSKDRIQKNMDAQLVAKQKTRKELEKITDNIEWLNTAVKNHGESMKKAQEEIDAYMPTYKNKINSLQKGIMDLVISDDEVKNIVGKVAEEMEKQNKILEREITKPVVENSVD